MDRKFSIIGKFKKTHNDIICDISQIILPFEYIIIQVILYFEFNDQTGGAFSNIYKKMTREKVNTKNASLEQKIFDEIGRPPGKSVSDIKLLNTLKQNKYGIKKTIKKTNKLLKNSDLSNLVVDISDTLIDSKNDIYNEENEFSSHLEQYPVDDKHDCFQSVIKDTDSWLFKYYFYKAKFNECEYYYEGFEKYFINKKKEIDKNNNNKINIIETLEKKTTQEDSEEEDEEKSEEHINKNIRKLQYIHSLKQILEDKKYFNELLMMFQFNKNWIDNYYDFKNKEV